MGELLFISFYYLILVKKYIIKTTKVILKFFLLDFLMIHSLISKTFAVVI